MYGNFDEKTDVFSFGVVLLELISGRKPIDRRYPESQQSLVQWVSIRPDSLRLYCRPTIAYEDWRGEERIGEERRGGAHVLRIPAS